jgi:hypothetical protein
MFRVRVHGTAGAVVRNYECVNEVANLEFIEIYSEDSPRVGS